LHVIAGSSDLAGDSDGSNAGDGGGENDVWGQVSLSAAHGTCARQEAADRGALSGLVNVRFGKDNTLTVMQPLPVIRPR
jgi:hypothetical protein